MKKWGLVRGVIHVAPGLCEIFELDTFLTGSLVAQGRYGMQSEMQNQCYDAGAEFWMPEHLKDAVGAFEIVGEFWYESVYSPSTPNGPEEWDCAFELREVLAFPIPEATFLEILKEHNVEGCDQDMH